MSVVRRMMEKHRDTPNHYMLWNDIVAIPVI
jgi:hypothetical protein